jgi:hypothetical protein
MIITQNQIIKAFNKFVIDQPQLNDFGYGPVSEIGTSVQMKFPYMWVTHTAPSNVVILNRTTVPIYRFTFLFCDQINQQENFNNVNGLDSDNGQEIISDMQLLGMDFITYINNELAQYGVNLLEEEQITFEPIFDETPDKVYGQRFDIAFKVRYTNCIIPF